MALSRGNAPFVDVQGNAIGNILAPGLGETKGFVAKGLDQNLYSIVKEAAKQFTAANGLKVEAFSGVAARGTGTPNHPVGKAIDVWIYDANGKQYPNSPEAAKRMGLPLGPAFRVYEQFAQTARDIQMQKYPELSGKLRWGGYFEQGTDFDLMHLDIGGGGMANGSWDGGVNEIGRKRLAERGAGDAVSIGMGDVIAKRIASFGYTGPDAIRQFQADAGISVDGRIGPETTGAVTQRLAMIPPADIPNVDKVDVAINTVPGGRSDGRNPRALAMMGGAESVRRTDLPELIASGAGDGAVTQTQTGNQPFTSKERKFTPIVGDLLRQHGVDLPQIKRNEAEMSAALSDFQRARGYRVTGTATPETFAGLKEPLPALTTTASAGSGSGATLDAGGFTMVDPAASQDDFSEFSPEMQENARRNPNVAAKLREIQEANRVPRSSNNSGLRPSRPENNTPGGTPTAGYDLPSLIAPTTAAERGQPAFAGNVLPPKIEGVRDTGTLPPIAYLGPPNPRAGARPGNGVATTSVAGAPDPFDEWYTQHSTPAPTTSAYLGPPNARAGARPTPAVASGAGSGSNVLDPFNTRDPNKDQSRLPMSYAPPAPQRSTPAIQAVNTASRTRSASTLPPLRAANSSGSPDDRDEARAALPPLAANPIPNVGRMGGAIRVQAVRPASLRPTAAAGQGGLLGSLFGGVQSAAARAGQAISSGASRAGSSIASGASNVGSAFNNIAGNFMAGQIAGQAPTGPATVARNLPSNVSNASTTQLVNGNSTRQYTIATASGPRTVTTTINSRGETIGSSVR